MSRLWIFAALFAAFGFLAACEPVEEGNQPAENSGSSYDSSGSDDTMN